MMLILEKGTYMPTQRALSGLVVFPSTLVLLTLEQTDARALEPTAMKIKMITPSSASIDKEIHRQKLKFITTRLALQ